MKTSITWLLLAIYLNASATMLLPFVRDMLAHLLFWQEHLEHVHQGDQHSHHVHEEIALQHEQDAPSPETPPPINQNILQAHLLPNDNILSALNLHTLTRLNTCYICCSQQVFPRVPSPPPDAIW